MKFTGERLVPDFEGYDALFLEHMTRYRFAAELVRGKRVLDVGCGCGYGTYHLSRAGAPAVLGIDVAEDAIAYCEKNYRNDGLAYEIRDAMATQLEAGAYDVIVAFEMFEHVDDPERLLREIRRLLADDGVLVISTPNAHTYATARIGERNEFHHKEYTPEEFGSMLEHVFPAVRFYTQGPAFGVNVLPVGEVGTQTSAKIEAVLPPAESTWGEVPDARVDMQRCAFMLAVCGTRLPTKLPSARVYVAGADLAQSRDHAVRQLQGELDERTRWALDMKRELEERDRTLVQLQKEYTERTAWALELKEKLDEKEKALLELHEEYDERTRWALDLQARVERQQREIAARKG